MLSECTRTENTFCRWVFPPGGCHGASSPARRRGGPDSGGRTAPRGIPGPACLTQGLQPPGHSPTLLQDLHHLEKTDRRKQNLVSIIFKIQFTNNFFLYLKPRDKRTDKPAARSGLPEASWVWSPRTRVLGGPTPSRAGPRFPRLRGSASGFAALRLCEDNGILLSYRKR